MEDRLIELEINIAYQNDLIDSMNLTITRQQQEIHELQQTMQLLLKLIRDNAGLGDEENKVQHEIPPHY